MRCSATAYPEAVLTGLGGHFWDRSELRGRHVPCGHAGLCLGHSSARGGLQQDARCRWLGYYRQTRRSRSELTFIAEGMEPMIWLGKQLSLNVVSGRKQMESYKKRQPSGVLISTPSIGVTPLSQCLLLFFSPFSPPSRSRPRAKVSSGLPRRTATMRSSASPLLLAGTPTRASRTDAPSTCKPSLHGRMLTIQRIQPHARPDPRLDLHRGATRPHPHDPHGGGQILHRRGRE